MYVQEERSLWEATDTYMKMSPFLVANKIKKPILLIHGEEDNNTGTFPMQSERFFSALKGHGATCRLVLLPHESHGYRGRESILHGLYEMCAWLDMFCAADAEPSNVNGGAQLEPEGDKAAEASLKA
jgi:dipeptidyl aminopeptidase/acylaminoacyl peptidase